MKNSTNYIYEEISNSNLSFTKGFRCLQTYKWTLPHFSVFMIKVYGCGKQYMASLNPGSFNGITIRNRLGDTPSKLYRPLGHHPRKWNQQKNLDMYPDKLKLWFDEYFSNCFPWECVSSSDEEKVGEKRSTAKKIVLTRQRIQAINLKIS